MMGIEIAAAAASTAYILPLSTSLTSALVAGVSGFFFGKKFFVTNNSWQEARDARLNAEALLRRNANEFVTKVNGEVEMVLINSANNNHQLQDLLQEFNIELQAMQHILQQLNTSNEELNNIAIIAKMRVEHFTLTLAEMQSSILDMSAKLQQAENDNLLKDQLLQEVVAQYQQMQAMLETAVTSRTQQIDSNILQEDIEELERRINMQIVAIDILTRENQELRAQLEDSPADITPDTTYLRLFK